MSQSLLSQSAPECFPTWRGRMEYVCLGCGARYAGDSLLYACPQCKGVFLLDDLDFDRLKERTGAQWRTLFDARAATRVTALRGIFRYYELLAPLSAKAFVVEDMRKMRYLEPERFTDCTQDVWDGYFFSEEPDGYFEGAHMDFNIIVPFSRKAEEGLWQQSKLEKVKAYILRQLED